jgi:hypothetical protein
MMLTMMFTMHSRVQGCMPAWAQYEKERETSYRPEHRVAQRVTCIYTQGKAVCRPSALQYTGRMI